MAKSRVPNAHQLKVKQEVYEPVIHEARWEDIEEKEEIYNLPISSFDNAWYYTEEEPVGQTQEFRNAKKRTHTESTSTGRKLDYEDVVLFTRR